MPEQTTNLKLPIPLGNENVNRQFFLDLIQAVDTGAVSERQLTEAIGQVAIALTQDYASTDQATAISADAVRRGLETKQNTVRLADNYLAASALINAAPDAQNRAYPDGFSFFKVSSAAGGWPTSNGYVMTMRAGSGGVQLYFEMYMGNVQSEKTARIWTRSKRDANGFWQEWNRVATETDLALKMDAARPSNLIPNGTAQFGLIAWTHTGGLAGFNAAKGSSHSPGEFFYTRATDVNFAIIESDRYLISTGIYNISAEFFVGANEAPTHYIEVLSYTSAGVGTIVGGLSSAAGDNWTRRSADVIFPANASTFTVRMVVSANKAASYRGFRKLQLTVGSGMKSWNDDSAAFLASALSPLARRDLELGQFTPGDGPAFIDFHTTGVQVDYNARILASNSAGKIGTGQGNITINALDGVYTDGPLFVQGTDLKKSVSDGKAAVRAAITGKGGTVADADGDGVPTHAELAAGVNSIQQSKSGLAILEYSSNVQRVSFYPIVRLPAGLKFLSCVPLREPLVTINFYSIYYNLQLRTGAAIVTISVPTHHTASTSFFVDVVNKKAYIDSGNQNVPYIETNLTSLDFNQPLEIGYVNPVNYNESFVFQVNARIYYG